VNDTCGCGEVSFRFQPGGVRAVMSCTLFPREAPWEAGRSVNGHTMTKRVKQLRHLATSSTKSSKWSVLIG